jgi:hypothetical protein
MLEFNNILIECYQRIFRQGGADEAAVEDPEMDEVPQKAQRS